MTIQEIVAQRSITELLHFTRLENLDSILNHGLLRRSDCAARGANCVITDPYRIDNQDALCLSVSFPNYKMFYNSRQQYKEAQWAVIGIRPEVLWQKDCAFCIENAASANVTRIPIANRKGAAAFSAMFDDFGEKKRADLKLLDKYTTNPQAEILVLDSIGPEYVLGAAFSSPQLTAAYSQRYSARYQIIHCPSFFSARSDYSSWKKLNG